MSYSIELPDGSLKKFSKAPTGLEVAQSLGPRLAKEALGFLKNESKDVCDIRETLEDGDKIRILSIKDEAALEVLRHSAAHVLAQAVQILWPDVRVTIGPVIEQGFYYDFDTDKKFTPEDLQAIEKKMEELIKTSEPVVKEVWSSKKAIAYFEKQGELLKKTIIEDLNLAEVSVYKQGKWLDLCRGPHVQHLGQIGAIKVLSLSGAYWRGDSKNKQLQRIYGTAFPKKSQLKDFLEKLAQAEENDHRVLGKKQDLFWFSDQAPGHPFFTPKGTHIYNKLRDFLRSKYKEHGYDEVISPQVFHEDTFKSSGHLQHFKENMYPVHQEEQASSYLKPMNCPGHCLFYKKARKSYRDLPVRLADFGRLHRNELQGALQGLTRVRSFCQDDAHIFCRVDQLTEEIKKGLLFMQDVYSILGLSDYKIHLSTQPETCMGSKELWTKSEQALSQALKALDVPFEIQEGEGAFYGPKIDISVRDSFSRMWQLGTFQCDFNLPEAFNLSYKDEQDQEKRPVMIHRALLGSLERFIGVYLEHCKGRLPFWLCPVQTIILPLTDKELEYSGNIQKKLAETGIICKIDKRNEKLSYKIRQAQLLQIPYMIIIGKQEIQSDSISIRLRQGQLLKGLSLQEAKSKLVKENTLRSPGSLFIERG